MKKKIIIWSVVAIVVVIVLALVFHKGTSYQFVSVTQQSITESVEVTGNTTPIQSLDLAFQNGGQIAAVYKNAGDAVSTGDVIARLDTSDLQAQLAQAQAGVQAAQATLANLQAGPTPQSIQVSQTAVTAAEQSLANTYAGIPDALTSALAKANDAIRNQITALYNSPESNNPQLAFMVSDSQVMNDAASERVAASQELNAWQTELSAINTTSPTSTLAAALSKASMHLNIISNLLTTDSEAVVDSTSIPPSTVATYKNDIATAVTEVSNAASSIDTASQSLASQAVAISQAQAQLAVTLSGSTQQAIAAQQAAVAQAQANAQSVQVKINEASLLSPIDGVVTIQNAKPGEIATPGQTVTSIISADNLEVDTDVPETDIGKITIGDAVSMTFDAFPGETFSGKVFYIDPAQTVVGGVVDYLTKISFDKADSRIKSGLTANLTIETQTDNNALVLPQYAIIQNTSGTFVEVLQNGATAQIPVTLGIQDNNGNVEVKSGVTAGEQVINIGLKTN
jgi:HlyD family secretion protein